MDKCPHCGKSLDQLSVAAVAIRAATLTKEEDEKIVEFIQFLVWRKKQAKRRKP